jgi:hypothetical protein
MDSKVHKAKHKLFEKEERLSRKEDKLHKRVEKAEHKKEHKKKVHKKKTHVGKKGEHKIEKVMREFKHGELHSGSKKGPRVSSRKQAVAIALSEARKKGARIPKKKK